MNRIELKSDRRRGRGTVAVRNRRLRPIVMALEGRTLLSTFTVTTGTDYGTGSLRWAIEQANGNNQANTIVFSSFLTGSEIALGSPLTLTNPATTTIDGPGAYLLTITGFNACQVFDISGGSAALSGLTISGGNAEEGGGLLNSGGTLTLTNCVISGNVATDQGGGLATCNHGTTTLTNCSVSGNTAPDGAGLASDDGTLALTNTTVGGNDAANQGGGLYNSGGAATLTNCTVSANSAATGGGVSSGGAGATLRLTNTIVAGQTAGGDVDGSYTGGNNLIGGKPLLAALGDYGGPTFTMPPLPGSAAIGGGTSAGAPSTDQRGFARSARVDIGALQTQGSNTVNTTSDGFRGPGSGLGQLSLRQAVNLADALSNAQTIDFDPGLFSVPQTITLNAGALELTEPATTTIVGPGPNLLTISGSGGGPVFEVTSGAAAALSALTITGGRAVGGDGGGVLNDGGNLTMTNSVVRGNDADSGGGLAAMGTGCTTTLVDCTITGNVVGGNSNGGAGGGIYNAANATLNMTDCTISGNVANVTGGGIFNADYTTLTATDCTISNNSSSSVGGGLTNEGTATLSDVTVSRNNASRGGGGLLSTGTLAMTGCTVNVNSASYYGGGLVAYHGGKITLTNCTVSGNSTAGGGGGAANVLGTLALSNCTVSGNSAGGSGGGLDNGSASTPVLATSKATPAGGSGAGANYESTMSLTNCTVSGNTAYGGDGGVANYDTLSLTNTIVAGNNGGDVGGSYTGSHNLIGGDPLLSALGDYAGPTATIALLPGSPAIGAGTSTGAPTFDQRGQPRSGHVDIGAFQSQGFTLTPVASADGHSTPVNQPFPKPVTFAVTANNPVEPVDGGIVRFAVTPAGGASATLSAATANIAGGVASVTATANTTIGKYFVSATATGADPDGFALTNTERPSLIVTTNLDEVDDTDGLTSLREAIAYANSLPGPQTIIFDPAVFGTKPLMIRLTGGPIVVTDPATITIVGPGAKLLTMSGGGKSRVFDIEGGSLALSGLTIANGNADLGGGLCNEGGRLLLTGVAIRGNRAIVGGGLFNDGRTTLSRVVIKGNRAHVGSGLFNTRAATLLWRRSPAANRGRAPVDHTPREETPMPAAVTGPTDPTRSALRSDKSDQTQRPAPFLTADLAPPRTQAVLRSH
jgi:parallel beta-helix repeat protein